MNTTVQNAINASIAALEVTSSVPNTPYGYGSDMWCEADLDPRMKEVSEEALVLAQHCVRRLDTPNGLPDDNEWGISITDYLNLPTTTRELAEIEGAISAELREDDRVDYVDVSVEFSADYTEITIDLNITPLDSLVNEFTLILNVSDAGIIIEEMRTS